MNVTGTLWFFLIQFVTVVVVTDLFLRIVRRHHNIGVFTRGVAGAPTKAASAVSKYVQKGCAYVRSSRRGGVSLGAGSALLQHVSSYHLPVSAVRISLRVC